MRQENQQLADGIVYSITENDSRDKVYFLIFQKPRQMRIFQILAESRLFRGFDLFHLSLPQKRILMDPSPG
jgi:hypothetical protein